jgi:hypothetical protein
MLRTIEFIDLLNVLWAKPTINPTVTSEIIILGRRKTMAFSPDQSWSCGLR